MGSGSRLFLLARNLGPYTKEIKLLATEDGLVLVSSWVLECYNEGGVVTSFVGGRGANPAWFLCNLEGGIGGVVSSECIVTLVWGPWAAGFTYSCEDVVDKKSGPFDIGLCLEGVRCLESGGVCFSE